MAPTRPRPVGPPSDTRNAPDAWSLYYPDQTSTSSLPMHGTPQADDLPLRNNSRPRPGPNQAKHRNKKWLTLDPFPARPLANVSLARPTLQQRIDDFAVSLPLSAGDKLIDYGINATRKLGRAASKRLHQLQHNSNTQPPSPIIGQPTLTQWDNLDNQRLVDRESVLADQLARSQEWQQNQPHTPSPVHHRRIVLSTWGAVLEAAYKPPTPPEERTEPSVQPRYQDPADMTSTQRKPARNLVNVDKPLPPVPRPDSLRRKTVILRSRPAAASPDGSLDPQSDNAALAAHQPPFPSTSHSSFYSQAYTNSAPDDESHAPVVNQSLRTGQVPTHIHQVRSAERIDSWHVQLARADSTGRSVVASSEYEDGATSLWRTLEARVGVRMRD